MFQDEKTTELDLNAKSHETAGHLTHSRWTEQTTQSIAINRSATSAIERNHIPWLLKLAAAVTILILSLWLF